MFEVSYKKLIYASIGLVAVVLIGTFGYWFITDKEYKIFITCIIIQTFNPTTYY